MSSRKRHKTIKTFTQTCDKPYDRHSYTIMPHNHTVEDYDHVKQLWGFFMAHPQTPNPTHVIING